MPTLTPDEAKAFYDRFGSKQDSQAFYELPALQRLVASSSLEDAHAVFEFGCGTGRLARELLERHLPPDAVYRGVDLSRTMVELAASRLAPFAGRAAVEPAPDEPAFPLADASVDRVLSTYVLDLLPDPAVRQFLAEARRVLRPEGLLCLAGITHGVTPLSRAVMGVWGWLAARRPAWVGGCRPVSLQEHLSRAGWTLRFHTVVVAWGVASEVTVAS